MKRLKLCVLALTGLALSWGLLACREEPAPSCRQQTMGQVTAYVGSLVRGGTIEPGPPLSCRKTPSIHAAHKTLVRTYRAIPAPLRPNALSVHYEVRTASRTGSISHAETHKRGSAILLARGAVPTVSVWLHELAHLALPSFTFSNLATTRLQASLEEGFADYYAAVLGHSHTLEAHLQPRSLAPSLVRDLSAKHVTTATQWAALALPSRFDPHVLGAAFAASLHQARPGSIDFLQGVFTALQSTAEQPADSTPSQLLQALVNSCPSESRLALQELLYDWVPASLFVSTAPIAALVPAETKQ